MSRALFLACAGVWKIFRAVDSVEKTSTAACQQTGAVTLLACTVTVCEGFGSATAGNGSLGPTESVAWLSAHRDTLCKAACVLLLSVDLLVHEIFKREVGRSSSQVAVAAETRRTGLHFCACAAQWKQQLRIRRIGVVCQGLVGTGSSAGQAGHRILRHAIPGSLQQF